ncbi:hypothetical protein PsorP6_003757 [Peronosclerospora sorghi]|uniref:Uncharacterized protein n=1 Tax=Peronosclerospora sorghi TaxID=230839 RepID=A0ACC0VMR9_9STRA|nr:hypothetical protein PsorP6_003757 [Peronosclerospora sorghi]
MIEKCLQQYLSKSDILMVLKGQANVDPAFTNVVWQKLVEQNPNFFRAYSLQLQLKEQIIAFNYLVLQQKEMMTYGGNRIWNYSNKNRTSETRASASEESCTLITSSTTTTLHPTNLKVQTFQHTLCRSIKRQGTPVQTDERKHMRTDKVTSLSVGLGATPKEMAISTLPSPLPLPSPVKTDLDTHAFFT